MKTKIVNGSLRSAVFAAVALLAAVRTLKSRANYFAKKRTQRAPTIDAKTTAALIDALAEFVRAHDGTTPTKSARKDLFRGLIGRHFKIGRGKARSFPCVESVEFENGATPVALFDNGTRRDVYYLAYHAVETDADGNKIPFESSFRRKYLAEKTHWEL